MSICRYSVCIYCLFSLFPANHFQYSLFSIVLVFLRSPSESSAFLFKTWIWNKEPQNELNVIKIVLMAYDYLCDPKKCKTDLHSVSHSQQQDFDSLSLHSILFIKPNIYDGKIEIQPQNDVKNGKKWRFFEIF